MNILYISYDGITDPLGQSQILPYLKKLSRQRCQFILLSFDKKSHLNDQTLVNKIRQSLRESNIRWEVLKYHKAPSLLATLYDITVGILLGYWLIKKNNISIIHARSYVASLIALCLKNITGCKFVFDMRGFWPEERVDAGFWKKNCRLYKIAKFFEKKFILNSDWIIVLTQKAKELMAKYSFNDMKKNIDIIPTCVDLATFSIKRKDNVLAPKIGRTDRFIFMYLGSIGTWYCINEMLSFLRIARQKIRNTYFICLTPYYKKEIEQLILSYDFCKDDFMVKGLYYDEIPEWLSIADVSLFFIKPVASKIASCPTKLAESLACGLPVIINSGIGDSEEIVKKEDVGVVIDKFSDIEYRNALEELGNLLSNDREALKQKCHRVAEKYFSLNDGAEKYGQIYQRLIKI